MNTLDRYNIAYKELSVGTYHFSMSIDDAFFNAFEKSQIISGDGNVEIELTKGGSLLTLSFEIEANAGVECDRCLEEVIIPIDYESTLTVGFSDTEMECDGDTMWLTPDQDQLNVAHYIYESIYLSLPYQRVHEEGLDGELECNADMLEHFKIVSEEEFDVIATKGDVTTIEHQQGFTLSELKEKLTQK